MNIPPPLPVFQIVSDIHTPSDVNGGISSLLPAGHPHAGHNSAWYHRQLIRRLNQLGYQHTEDSCYARQTTLGQATVDACSLQTFVTLTWMAVPGGQV
jgi:hypothetical protein